MEVLTIILVIIGLTLGICLVVAFFTINNNIKEIKAALLPAIDQYQKSASEARRVEYYVAASVGDNAPTQLRALTAIIYAELIKGVMSISERNKKYEELKERYSEIFTAANCPFPANIQQR